MNKLSQITQLQQISDFNQTAKQVFDRLDVAPSTIADYKARISLFIDFVQDQGGLTVDSFGDFKKYLRGLNHYGVSTKNKYLASSRIFLKELHKRRPDLLPSDITQNVKGFSQTKKHKRSGLSEDQVQLVMKKINDLDQSPKASRLKAILILLTVQGLRQVELIRLDVEDLDLIRGKAFVLGKGRDDKEDIDLHPLTAEALGSYLQLNGIKSGPLFISQSNRTKGNRLTTRSVRRIVKGFLGDLEITDKVVHGFRHYFTTKLIKTFEGDLLKVAKFTRHKSLEMLQVYNDDIQREADLPGFYKAFSF